MNIADLFARIGIKDEGSAPLSRFINTASNALTALTTVARAAVDVTKAIRDVARETLDAAAAYKQFAVETGASTDDLQKWQAVAKQTNNSAQAVTEAIKALASNREKIKLGQGNISGYQLLGIDPNQDPFEVMEALRTQTKNLPQAMKKNMMQQLGVSSDLLQVIELSNEEFDKMAGNAFIIPRSAIESLDKARSAMGLVGDALKYIKSMIIVGLAPSLRGLSKQFSIFIKANQKNIVRGFKDAFEWVQKFITSIIRTGTYINEIVRGTIGWENAVKGLIVVFALLNASLLASPITWIIAGIIALVLVMEDLYVYSKGGRSLFGLMLEGMKEFDKVLDSWGTWGDVIQTIILGLEKILTITAELATKKGGMVDLVKDPGAWFKRFGELASDPNNWLGMIGLGPYAKGAATAGATNNSSQNITISVTGVLGDPAETAAAIDAQFRRTYHSGSAQTSRDE